MSLYDTNDESEIQKYTDDTASEIRSYGWNDRIKVHPASDFKPIDGEYDFDVAKFEKSRFTGSSKMEPCNQANMTLMVHTEEGPVSIRTNLKLHHMFSKRIAQFFLAIGDEVDESGGIRMNWSNLVGRKGRAQFGPRTYVGNDGKEHTITDVIEYIPCSSDDSHDDHEPGLKPGSDRNY